MSGLCVVKHNLLPVKTSGFDTDNCWRSKYNASIKRLKSTGLLKVIANVGKTASVQCGLLNAKISGMKISKILWSY